jgi:hypothetical protein
LADVWPDRIKGKNRVANPGCFPAATLIALAPLLVDGLIEPGNIIVDAKTGISGAGRGGCDTKLGFAENNENLKPYGLLEKFPTRLNRSAGSGLVQDQGVRRGAYRRYGQVGTRRNWAKPVRPSGFNPADAHFVRLSGVIG